ncbi:hypothetical protein M0D21_21890 [Aquimarina sp. D1M17]|uniref:hypothetical protein n=1 Tax=Aquimarina acroporae TaxID=2937283 RepID=UPI0020C0C14E|nr:hypothetical protein [Aquimarina acroporae]MCK8524246.1 hypothetical protein [Aquimarina acroporae]
MKNLQELSNIELSSISGGCQMDPCPSPTKDLKDLILGDDFPIPPFGDPRDQDYQFPY